MAEQARESSFNTDNRGSPSAPSRMSPFPIAVTVPGDEIESPPRSTAVSSGSVHHVLPTASGPPLAVPSSSTPNSPGMNMTGLQPNDDRGKSTKKSRKRRALSNSSALSGGSSGIAKALAKSGLHLVSPTNGEGLLSSAHSSHTRSPSTHRSPFLVRGNGAEDGSGAHDGDEGAYDEDYDDEDDDDDTDSDRDSHLPVTGFAVASNKRQADFHAMFPSVDEGDYLIEGVSGFDCGCDK